MSFNPMTSIVMAVFADPAASTGAGEGRGVSAEGAGANGEALRFADMVRSAETASAAEATVSDASMVAGMAQIGPLPQVAPEKRLSLPTGDADVAAFKDAQTTGAVPVTLPVAEPALIDAEPQTAPPAPAVPVTDTAPALDQTVSPSPRVHTDSRPPSDDQVAAPAPSLVPLTATVSVDAAPLPADTQSAGIAVPVPQAPVVAAVPTPSAPPVRAAPIGQKPTQTRPEPDTVASPAVPVATDTTVAVPVTLMTGQAAPLTSVPVMPPVSAVATPAKDAPALDVPLTPQNAASPETQLTAARSIANSQPMPTPKAAPQKPDVENPESVSPDAMPGLIVPMSAQNSPPSVATAQTPPANTPAAAPVVPSPTAPPAAEPLSPIAGNSQVPVENVNTPEAEQAVKAARAQTQSQPQPQAQTAAQSSGATLASAEPTPTGYTPAGTLNTSTAQGLTQGQVMSPATPPQSYMSQDAVHNLQAVSAQIQKTLKNGNTQFSIALHPAHMGRVDVNLRIDAQGRVMAEMIFDKAAVADDFANRQDDLRQQLTQAGLKLEPDSLTFRSREADLLTRDNGTDRQSQHGQFEQQMAQNNDRHNRHAERAAAALRQTHTATPDPELDLINAALADVSASKGRLALNMIV